MLKAAAFGHQCVKRQVPVFGHIKFNYQIEGRKKKGLMTSNCWLHLDFDFRVPNIKFNVAKVLQSLIPIFEQSVSLIYLSFQFFVLPF